MTIWGFQPSRVYFFWGGERGRGQPLCILEEGEVIGRRKREGDKIYYVTGLIYVFYIKHERPRDLS